MDLGILENLHLVACGHGTRNELGQRTIAALVESINRRIPQEVHGASVDVQKPEVGDVVAGLPIDRSGIIIPLLLSTGFHTRVDLKNAARRFGEAGSGTFQTVDHQIVAADPLGPSVRLARLQARRLAETGWRRGDAVVMGVVGSSVAAGKADAETQASYLERVLQSPVGLGFGAAASPTVSEAVDECRRQGAPRVFVSSYILAPGTFQDRLMDTDADSVSDTLLRTDDPRSLELVSEVALSRAAECFHRFLQPDSA
ncbi:sirohydrochlorin chelatase [Kocuria sp. TGY1127_2]|uniref:sirohydrochlorin chelatase n=1 Tax=Kocuria sp. TGY1127_2 TaxID=2711328 RepID=UPI0015BDCE24|nr:CbiX/SirB N-terminal domain-containing protein [Kocuria sp. TGY1127_2]